MAHAPKSISRTFINAPLETVWSTLVATDRPLPFFFGAVCQTKDGLRPGEKMRMVNPSGTIAMVVGEVLTFEPPHRYAHTFQMTDIDEPPCVVTYELREKDGGTEFDLIITEAIEGSKLHKQMLSGQKFIATNLKTLVETGKPAITGRLVRLLGPVMALLAQKKQRIEHWPL